MNKLNSPYQNPHKSLIEIVWEDCAFPLSGHSFMSTSNSFERGFGELDQLGFFVCIEIKDIDTYNNTTDLHYPSVFNVCIKKI